MQWLLLLWSTGSRLTGLVVPACHLSNWGLRALEHEVGGGSQLLKPVIGGSRDDSVYIRNLNTNNQEFVFGGPFF